MKNTAALKRHPTSDSTHVTVFQS